MYFVEIQWSRCNRVYEWLWGRKKLEIGFFWSKVSLSDWEDKLGIAIPELCSCKRIEEKISKPWTEQEVWIRKPSTSKYFPSQQSHEVVLEIILLANESSLNNSMNSKRKPNNSRVNLNFLLTFSLLHSLFTSTEFSFFVLFTFQFFFIFSPFFNLLFPGNFNIKIQIEISLLTPATRFCSINQKKRKIYIWIRGVFLVAGN